MSDRAVSCLERPETSPNRNPCQHSGIKGTYEEWFSLAVSKGWRRSLLGLAYRGSRRLPPLSLCAPPASCCSTRRGWRPPRRSAGRRGGSVPTRRRAGTRPPPSPWRSSRSPSRGRAFLLGAQDPTPGSGACAWTSSPLNLDRDRRRLPACPTPAARPSPTTSSCCGCSSTSCSCSSTSLRLPPCFAPGPVSRCPRPMRPRRQSPLGPLTPLRPLGRTTRRARSGLRGRPQACRAPGLRTSPGGALCSAPGSSCTTCSACSARGITATRWWGRATASTWRCSSAPRASRSSSACPGSSTSGQRRPTLAATPAAPSFAGGTCGESGESSWSRSQRR